MDDIDDVRRHLGYDTINLWGGSYGTRAALVYLKRHEGSVRSMVLDGVAPTDMQLPLYVARDGQRALDRLIDDCAGDPPCAAEFPSLRQSVTRLWAPSWTSGRRCSSASANRATRHADAVAAADRRHCVPDALQPRDLSAPARLMTDAAEGRYQGLLALAFAQDLPKGAVSDGMFLSVVCWKTIRGSQPPTSREKPRTFHRYRHVRHPYET